MVQKKYFPFLALLIVAILLFWIKKNQRGTGGRNAIQVEVPADIKEPFNRNERNIKYSKHALCRMDCRQIDAFEVMEILKEGKLNYDKIEENNKGTTYPLEGITRDRQFVRVVFAPHDNELVVVTVIDLEKEWPCSCN